MSSHIRGMRDAPQTAPVYLIHEGDMTIDAPVNEAWRHVIDYSSWQSYSVVQHISGTPANEGEVVLLKKAGGDALSTPYYARTVKLDPGRRIIWKTYRENVEYFGLIEFSVCDVQGKTRFRYRLFYEHVVPFQVESELEAFRKQQQERLETLSSARFMKLKELLEEGS